MDTPSKDISVQGHEGSKKQIGVTMEYVYFLLLNANRPSSVKIIFKQLHFDKKYSSLWSLK